MKIRNAGMKDAAELDAMLTKLIRYESRWDENLDTEYTVQDNYSHMIGHPDCRIWIAEIDGEIGGYLCAILHRLPMYRKPVVILDALYIEEPYRRKGYATALFQKLWEFANETDAAFVELKVFADNVSAGRLYAKQGFVEIKKYMKGTVRANI